TEALFERMSVGLMRRLFQHGGEPEEITLRWLVDNHFLLIFIDGADSDSSRDKHIGLRRRVSDLIDAFEGSEGLDLDLAGQHRQFIIIQQSKKRDISQHFRLARHDPSLLPTEVDSTSCAPKTW